MCMLTEYLEYKAHFKRIDMTPCSYAQFISSYKIEPLCEGYWRK